MMQANVKVNIDPRLIAKRVPRADHALAVRAADDTEKFVPMLTGSLKNRTKVEGNKIIYPDPYAHYLYVGKVWAGSSRYGGNKHITDKNLVFTKAFHADAQAAWFEASKALNLPEWLKFYGKAVTRGGE